MVRGRRRGSNVERQLIAVHMGDRESLLSADWRSSSYSDDTLLSMLDIDTAQLHPALDRVKKSK
jgi:hypothetical protein